MQNLPPTQAISSESEECSTNSYRYRLSQKRRRDVDDFEDSKVEDSVVPNPKRNRSSAFDYTDCVLPQNFDRDSFESPSIPQTQLHRPQLTTLKNLKTKKPKLQVAPSDRVLRRKK
jgi:hypothetical protein